MSEETARKSCLGGLIKKDPILQNMGNVALALHLLNEFVRTDSQWLPYLRILPSSYVSTLYFTPEQMDKLRGSIAFEEALKQFRNIARQYAYFYKILFSLPEAKSWPIRHYFTFNNYRWAVATVMSRQNLIPVKSSSNQLGLIPAWDLANHEEGIFSTDFLEDSQSLACYAQRDFQSGQQFTIHYGNRSNMELFLHSGFVYPGNAYDKVGIKLGLSKSDPLYDQKSKLLFSFGISPNGIFFISHYPNSLSDEIVIFTRVFCICEETITEYSSPQQLSVLKCPFGDLLPLDEAVRKYLTVRIGLLLRAYTTKLKEDDCQNGNSVEGLTASLLAEEKKILNEVLSMLQEPLC